MIGFKPVSAAAARTAKVSEPTATGDGFQAYLDQRVSAPASLSSIFSEMSGRFGVSENLLKAVAKAESNFNPDAVSSCGAMGIMQLMPSTASSLGVADAYDAQQNIMGGAKLLSQLLEKYNGDVKFALAAYNAGSGNVDKYGGVPPFEETQTYVNRILGYLGEGDVAVPDTAIQKSTAQIQTSYDKNSYALGNLADSFTAEDYELFIQLFYAQMSQLQNNQFDSYSGSLYYLG